METSPENRRTGKIARLPYELRNNVNLWLRDGASSQLIIQRLDEAGHPGINEVNITHWYKGGHQTWLQTQDRISQLSARREAAMEMVKAVSRDGTVTLADANEMTLASMINETLADYDVANLKGLLGDDPKKFFDLAMTIARQSNEQRKREAVELDYKQYRDKMEEREKKAVTELKRTDVSDEEKTAKMRQLFGL